MDQTLIGESAAKMMDALDNDARVSDGKLIAVGIITVVEIETDKGNTTTECRTYSTEEYHHRAVGLFTEGLESVQDGGLWEDEMEDDEEEAEMEDED